MERSKQNGSKKLWQDAMTSGSRIAIPLMLWCLSGPTIALANSGKMAIVQQQTNEVEGVVKDANGEPIIGATVVQEGTSNGTVTDLNGNFKLRVAPGAVLKITFIGYTDVELKADGRKSYSVVMEEKAKGIEEVVVIGYGTAKKKDLTGAIGSASGDLLTQIKSTNLSNTLQGTIPGLLVTRSSNGPADVKVRGITTISNSSPLIMVDGIPVGDMNNVNPNDIENVTVLKDAASASIYGARAAAGVILITTKRANDNTFKMKYNFEFGFDKATERPIYADAVRYMKAENELRWNDADNDPNSTNLAHAQDKIDDYWELHKHDPDNYPAVDFWDAVMKTSLPRQSHYLDIMGGTKKLKTKLSLGYDRSEGYTVNNYQNRFTVRANNNLTINKYISTTFDLALRRASNESPIQSPVPKIYLYQPIFPLFWANGGYAVDDGGANEYAQMLEGGTSKNLSHQLTGKASITVTPLKGLSLTGVFSSNLNFFKGKTFQKKVGYYSKTDPTLFVNYYNGWSDTKLNENRNDSHDYTIQFYGNYEKSFKGGHNFNVMAGYEGYKYFHENLSAGREQYTLSQFPYLDLGSEEYRNNGGNATENAYQSFFGRLMYNYKNKYLIQANVRMDASSRFHPDYRWGTFPSVSLGWVASEEPFYEKVKSWMPYLKLRMSWGNLGNERIGSNYPYQSLMRYPNIIFLNRGDVSSLAAAVQSGMPIKNISWETTTSTDFGLDAYFFDNRLSFTADYYYKKTSDMLLALEIPDFVGYSNPQKNTGIMTTKGFELQVGWRDRIGELDYGVSFNISDFVSKMGDLGGTEFLGSQVKKEGSEFNEWYGYRSLGIFQTEDEVANSPKLNTSTKVGDMKYEDISGPDGIPDGKISPEYDRVLLGGSLPRFMYGFNLNLAYKNFDFSMIFQGVGKQNSLLSQDMIRPFINNRGNMPMIIESKYWSHYNTPEQNLNAKYPRLTNTGASTNYAMSDYWLYNGAYMRIKNVTLGYTLPTVWVKSIGIENFRIYVSATDLPALFKKSPKGWDPELTNFTYPLISTYLLGLSITL